VSDPSEFGPYLVYERLGQGGMATVHRAEKRGVGIRKPIALKRLLPHVAADPDLIKLFVDEARLASHLHHANVAQTYELGKVDDTFFIAMEYASGPTLSQIIRQCQKAAGEIPQTVTVNILAQICEALDYAHNLCDESGQSLRIIHRDVSPANIIVTNTGLVKLIDFGIAKATISSVKTQTGFIKGKFGYIAPEYITGKIDSRVDLFAVGVVAHEMLAGRRLFEGKDDFETLANIREMVMQPPSRWNPHVTPALDDIVMTALERDPDRRWQSAAAMQVALSNVAREFGLVVGGTQLAEWIDWAFSQVPRDAGNTRRSEPSIDTDSIGLDAGALRPRDSSVLIELSHAPTDLVETITAREARRGLSPSESDETLQLERVRISFNHLEVLTPPATPAAMPPAALPPPPPPPPRSRGHDSVPPPLPRGHDSVPPPLPRGRDSVPPPLPRGHDSVPPPLPRGHDSVPPPLPRGHDSVPPPLPPPKRAPPVAAVAPPPPRTTDAAVPTVPPSREIEVIVVPPGGMFEMAAPEPAEPIKPQPKPTPEAKVKAKAKANKKPSKAEPEVRSRSRSRSREDGKAEARSRSKAKAEPNASRKARPGGGSTASSPRKPSADPSALPRKRPTVLWLILLMIALGAGAMAAAYYWPAEL
jgi:eukaryotic-like serine/threonine-protein kinase